MENMSFTHTHKKKKKIFEAHIFEMRKIENHTNYFVSFLCEYEFF